MTLCRIARKPDRFMGLGAGKHVSPSLKSLGNNLEYHIRSYGPKNQFFKSNDLIIDSRKNGFVQETPFIKCFLQVMYQSTRLKYHFLCFWFGLSEYATDPKKFGGSEVYCKY